MRRLLAAVPLAVAALALPAASTAAEGPLPVHIEFQAFDPSTVDALPGDTVEWTNVSERTHTVTADDGSFDSGDLPGGIRFKRTFATVGSYPYHCRIHAGMTGEVDVRRVTLDPLPPGLVRTGTKVELSGRAADASAPVAVQRSTGGSFQTVATATPAADGGWKATITAEHTADYRAASGPDLSETRHLRVSDRTVKVRRTRHGLEVEVAPSEPYARVVLELWKRERFGWWPSRRRHLDYLSRASFDVKAPARARVELVADDGWTPLAVSRVVRLPRPAQRPQ